MFMLTGYLAITSLAVIIALIAKDLAIPLAGIAVFGLIDRLLIMAPLGRWKIQ